MVPDWKKEFARCVKTPISVVDAASYEAANQRISILQKLKKKIETFFKPVKQRAAEAHKQLCGQEKSELAPVLAALDDLKRKTSAYYAAEQSRIEAENRCRRDHAEAMTDHAETAASAGDTEEGVRAVALASLAGAVVAYMPCSPGTSMREIWRAEVVDAERVPRQWLMVNQAALDAFARATKGSRPVPGVRFVRSFTNATRSAR